MPERIHEDNWVQSWPVIRLSNDPLSKSALVAHELREISVLHQSGNLIFRIGWMDLSLIEHLEQCQQYFVLPGFIRTTCQQKRVHPTNTGPKWPFRCLNVCGLREFWNGFMYMGPYFYLVWLFVIFE